MALMTHYSPGVSWGGLMQLLLARLFSFHKNVQQATLDRIVEENNLLRKSPAAALEYKAVYYKGTNSTAKAVPLHLTLVGRMTDYLHGQSQAESDHRFLRQHLVPLGVEILNHTLPYDSGPPIFWQLLKEAALEANQPRLAEACNERMATSVDWPVSTGAKGKQITELLHLYNSYRLLAS